MSNHFTIVGNCGQDPELRFTQSGKAVVNISVGDTPRRFNRDTNAWEDAGDTLWMRCELWGDDAEAVAQRITKGMKVRVTGRLSQRSYDAQDGTKRTVIELKADDISEVVRASRTGNSAPCTTTTTKPTEDPWGAAPSASFGGGPDDAPF